MTGAHTVADVRAAEDVLLAELPDGALMQRASAALAGCVAQLLDSVYGARVGLLVGSGNNGGDGLFAGALLCRRGVRVEAVLIDPARVHPAGLTAFRAAGGRVVERLGACDLVLDAILGIGGSAGLRDDAWRHVQDLEAPVVSVDVPSGIDVDGGTLPGDGRHVRAAATVTFGTAKIGLLAGPAADCAGALRVIDIGLGPHLPEPSVRTVGVDDLQRLVRVPGPAWSATSVRTMWPASCAPRIPRWSSARGASRRGWSAPVAETVPSRRCAGRTTTGSRWSSTPTRCGTWTALHRCRRCSPPTPVSWRPCWAPSGPRSKPTP
jgi:hydroxyethylthiazole kinase-like uncharacterized protein yjeF